MNLAQERRLGSGALERHAEREIPLAWHLAKRTLDVAVALVALLLTAPLMLIAVLGILTVSPGIPFFMQERVGQDGRRFKMLKLRTMVRGAERMLDDVRHLNEVSGPVFKIRKDPRVHALGGVLRRLSLDEIPNFVNVLRGDMSVVGPRPPLPSEVEQYDRYALRRLSVKPGVTCLWQISGRSSLSFEEWMELDNRYIDTWTPALDVLIIAKTIPAVLRANGAH